MEEYTPTEFHYELKLFDKGAINEEDPISDYFTFQIISGPSTVPANSARSRAETVSFRRDTLDDLLGNLGYLNIGETICVTRTVYELILKRQIKINGGIIK